MKKRVLVSHVLPSVGIVIAVTLLLLSYRAWAMSSSSPVAPAAPGGRTEGITDQSGHAAPEGLVSADQVGKASRSLPPIDQPDPPPVVPTCALYTVGQQPGHRSQLLAIDLRNELSYSLGGIAETEIQALAVHPQTGVLYAVTDKWGNRPGMLYSVDRTTGALTSIGPHGFKSVTALAFRWTDETLWGWAQGVGLVQLDTATGASSLKFASQQKLSGLAWANDGTLLYASEKASLWSYSEGDAELQRVAENLPPGTNAIEMRSDGVLVGIARNEEPGESTPMDAGLTESSTRPPHPLTQAWVFIYDPIAQELVSQNAIAVRRVYPGFAGLAWPPACGNPSRGGPADMIRNITLDKTEVCPGEDVLVTVDAVHPESPQGQVDIAINGRWGNPQYVQYTGYQGERIIVVVAATPEKFSDTDQVTIDVLDCGEDHEFLQVTVRPNPFHEYTVDFEIGNAEAFSDQDPVYLWDFGDGETLETTVPYAAHSFAAVIARDELYSNFLATITLQREGQADLTTHKMITLWNMYAFNKEKGLIQLPVESDEFLQPSGSSWTGDYTITNLEDEPIELTSRLLTLQPCDPEVDVVAPPAETISVELPGQGQVTLELNIPGDQISAEMCGAEVALSGHSQEGTPAYANAYFELQRNPVMTQIVDDEALRELLNHIAAEGLVGDPLHITDEELYRLAREGKITFPISPTASTAEQSTYVTSPSDGIIGQPCLPGDPPPRPGVSCQTTGNWTVAPPHIANARKGDAILSPGCGLIGGLLRQLSPPQRYSHVGIMTRDYYEVRHSTSSEERYQDNLVGLFGTAGFDDYVLRYGWPGVITQSVDEAFNGQYMADPDGKSYLVVGFHADPVHCDGDIQLVYPLVVKPPPGAPRSVREQLHMAADMALATDGHYRFYAYSNGAIALDSAYNAPDTRPAPFPWLPPIPFWAAGTPATVCSQFVWYSLWQAGIQLEGPYLEETDVALGAERDLLTLDGLYKYTEAERRAGAYWLHGKLHARAYDKAGWFGDLVTDAADHISNQFTNCFVWDGCSTDDHDSEAWRNPGVGRTVSPDNILFWDGPDTGGVYGYSEPLVYRGGDYVAETVWKPSPGVGTFAGRVLDRGDPVPDASVTIAGLELFTDASGEFRDEMIPAGTYEVVASKLIGGFYMSVRQEVTINPGDTTWVELTLQPPPQYIRRVEIEGWMYLLDDEVWPVPDETGYFTFYEARTVDIFQRDATVEIERCVGDEVRVELKFHLHLKESDNRTVEVRRVYSAGVSAHAWLYEGTSCDTSDLEDWGWWHPQGDPGGVPEVPAGATGHFSLMRLENSEPLADDYADIELWVTNGQQTFPTAGAAEGSAEGQHIVPFSHASPITETAPHEP